MSRAHENLVADQFGPQARAYVESTVHSQGEDLAALEAIVARAAPAAQSTSALAAGTSPI